MANNRDLEVLRKLRRAGFIKNSIGNEKVFLPFIFVPLTFSSCII